MVQGSNLKSTIIQLVNYINKKLTPLFHEIQIFTGVFTHAQQ